MWTSIWTSSVSISSFNSWNVGSLLVISSANNGNIVSAKSIIKVGLKCGKAAKELKFFKVCSITFSAGNVKHFARIYAVCRS